MLFTPLLSEDNNRFVPLLLVLLLAFLAPIVLARFRRIPVVVGEIVAGIIVGPSLLGWVTDGPILTFIADVGLAFLMFLAGMEIELEKLLQRPRGRPGPDSPNGMAMAALVYGLTFILAMGGGLLLVRLGAEADPWLLAFVLSATSLGVVLPILKERNVLNSGLGQLIFLSATLADFITVILLTIYIITFDRGFNLEILSLGLLFLAFLLFYRAGPSFVRIPRVRRFFDDFSHATIQIKVRGAITILVAFVVLAEFLDAELILGAFLAGMIISLLKSPEDDALVHKLEAFGFGFFIPVFFIMVGAGLDLKMLFAMPEKLLLIPAIYVVALVVKILPLLALRKWFPGKELLAGGILLNTHLSLEIAIAVIGLRTGLFDPATSTDIILLALLTVLTMPVLFNALIPYSPVSRQRGFILTVGVTDLGIRVAQELRAHGSDVRFLEKNADLLARAMNADFAVIEGSPDGRGLSAIDTSQLEALLALSEDDEQNLDISRAAKIQGVGNIVALVHDPAYLSAFQALKVQPFMSAIHRVTMIAMMARNPDTFTLLTSTADQRDIIEVRMRNPSLVYRPLRDLRLPGDYLVLAVRRGGELIIPRGNTVLEPDDRLTLVGDIDGLVPIRDWLEGRAFFSDGMESPLRELVS